MKKPRRAKWEVAFTRDALLDAKLRPAERAIIQAIAGWASWDLRSDATKAQISEGANVCQRQIWTYLRSLKAKGYLDWQEVRLRGKFRCIYQLLPPCGIRMLKVGRLSMQFPHESLKKTSTVQAPEGKPPPNVTPFPSPGTLPPSESDAPPPKPHRKEPVTREQRT